MKRFIIFALFIVSVLTAAFMLSGRNSDQSGLTAGSGHIKPGEFSAFGKSEAANKQSTVENGVITIERNQRGQSSVSSRSSPAEKMLEAADGSKVSMGIAAKNVSVFCAPYYEHLTNRQAAVSAKVAAWCSGIEKRVSVSELTAMSDKAATEISPIQRAVADLMSQKPGPEASSKALQLARIADSPGDMASSADMLKRFEADLIFKGTALSKGDPRSGTITHFAGIASWCSQASCGAVSEATMLVCTWPGFTCGANDDFNTALARNFSPTDMEKIATVGRRLTEIKSGY
jgi:hypothetical protein